MTPKDKANELIVQALIQFEKLTLNEAKKIALIAVDEIMKQCWDYRDIDLQASYDYWQEVKTEIKKL